MVQLQEMVDLDSMEVGSEVVDRREQEREEWFLKRAGKFTCSRFGDLAKSGRGKDELWGQAAWGYIYQVAAERCGSYQFEFDSAPTRWGKENEPQAIVEYTREIKPSKCVAGVDAWCEFNAYIGGTPDALIEQDGCLEVKCPYNPAEHMRYVHENRVPEKYNWQVLGHLLVSKRQWCDFVSFDPRIEGLKRMLIVRTLREDVKAQIEWLEKRLELANEVVKEIVG